MFTKLLLVILKLFKINKIFENTLSLRVAGNGTKKPVTTVVVPAFKYRPLPSVFSSFC